MGIFIRLNDLLLSLDSRGQLRHALSAQYNPVIHFYAGNYRHFDAPLSNHAQYHEVILWSKCKPISTQQHRFRTLPTFDIAGKSVVVVICPAGRATVAPSSFTAGCVVASRTVAAASGTIGGRIALARNTDRAVAGARVSATRKKAGSSESKLLRFAGKFIDWRSGDNRAIVGSFMCCSSIATYTVGAAPLI